MTAPSNNTPISIIQDAYFDAGLIGVGQNVNSEQIVMGMRKLTDLINLKQTQGLKLWLNVDTTVPLTSGTGVYTFTPGGSVDMTKPLRVVEAYYVDANGIRRPLTPLAWADYVRLSTVNQTGSINSYFVNKKQTELSVTLWPIPDATAALGTVHLVLQVQVTNFISLSETMNFPIEWRIALRWGLADELSTGQPQAIMDRCQQRAAAYWAMLEDWDVEDAPTRFTASTQGMGFGRFV